jgi:hypothetical protein
MDHWEVGVVLALRDAQWLEANPGANIPAMNISLDGNAESKMGDGVHQMGERFALLEIKPDQSFCQSEWMDKNGPKRAYKKLMNTAAIDEVKSGDPESRIRMSQSTRGHFFAYWGETSDHASHLDQLFLQPYILTALQALPAESTHSRPGSCYSGRPSRTHATALLDSLSIGQHNEKKFYPSFPLSLTDVLLPQRYTSCFCLKNPTANFIDPSALLPLGLEVDELQDYVNFLCKESIEDGCQKNTLEEDLKMMLVGSNGFIRHIRKTSELAQVITAYKQNSLIPTPGVAPTITRCATLNIGLPESTFKPLVP